MAEPVVDLIIARRLWRLYRSTWAGNLYEGLTLRKLRTVPPVSLYTDEYTRPDDDAWHLGRVRYFFEKLSAGEPVDAISVDNQCHSGQILPVPVVIDGHHRLIAAVKAGVRIPAHYSGRVDLLEYLTGTRRRPPEW